MSKEEYEKWAAPSPSSTKKSVDVRRKESDQSLESSATFNV